MSIITLNGTEKCLICGKIFKYCAPIIEKYKIDTNTDEILAEKIIAKVKIS